MLSEIYPGASPKIGSSYWDQIREVAVISVARRVLKRLHEFLEQVKFTISFDGLELLVAGDFSLTLLEINY